MKSTNVLFFYQHFWPDSTPYANMLRAIGKQLIDKGTTVSILTAQPSYRFADFDRKRLAAESVDGIQVRRLANLPFARAVRPIALVGKVLFPMRALFSLVFDRLTGRSTPDVIVAATIPPVINGLGGLLSARVCRAKFVYHLQDIYPEIGAVGGLWSMNSIRFKALLMLDTFICKRADACVVLSDDMHRSLRGRGVEAQRIQVINNFMLESFESNNLPQIASIESPVLNVERQKEEPYRLVFAGNLGRFQALDLLVKAFLSKSISDLPLEFHFLGDGAAKSDLIALAKGNKRIIFHGHVPVDAAARFVSGCDAGVVSLLPDVIRYAYPSKTFFYLGLGVPIFALVDTDSELAADIRHNNVGVVGEGATHESLVNSFKKLAAWLQQYADEQERICKYAQVLGSSHASAVKWASLIDSFDVNEFDKQGKLSKNN